MDVAGDMDIGAAAGPVDPAATGEPAVFSIRFGFVVQPDLKPLNMTVLIPVRHQKARMSENIPIPVVNIEAWDALQIVKVGENTRQETAGGAGFGEAPVHILLDTLFTQAPGQKIGPVLGRELQVHEHIIVGIMPDGQGAGLPFRRFL